MASNINPTAIDVTYPIAGQDNDTQGFRDNFSSIKNNFTVTKSEISAIQSVLDGTATLSTTVPASATAAGTKGTIAFDNNYLYVCVNTNSWLRVGIVGWPGSLSTFGNVTISGNLTTQGARVNAGYQYYAPSTNFTYTISNAVNTFILDPTGTITNGNVLLPSTTVDGTTISISSTQTVTNFQVTPNSGATLVPSANITLNAGTGATYFFHASESKWYKIA